MTNKQRMQIKAIRTREDIRSFHYEKSFCGTYLKCRVNGIDIDLDLILYPEANVAVRNWKTDGQSFVSLITVMNKTLNFFSIT